MRTSIRGMIWADETERDLGRQRKKKKCKTESTRFKWDTLGDTLLQREPTGR